VAPQGSPYARPEVVPSTNPTESRLGILPDYARQSQILTPAEVTSGSAIPSSSSVTALRPDRGNIWGLSFTPFLSASYTLEEFLDDQSYKKGSQDFNFSYAIGAFGDHRVGRYVAIGGDFDFLVLNPKAHVSKSAIKMFSLGPAIRFTIPTESVDVYFRLGGAFSMAILPDDIRQQFALYSDGTTESGSYGSPALGYLLKMGPGLMYRTGNVAIFAALAFEYSNLYTKLNWRRSGTVAELNVSPEIFGLEMGVAFSP
jgi:hypothetical protein